MVSLKRVVILKLLVLFLPNLVLRSIDGQQPVADIKPFLEEVRNRHGLVGLVCCVIKNGEIVALGAVGKRKAGSEQELTVDDKLHLGSCTKAMTATLVAQFVAEGKLKWDTKLLDVFSNLEDTVHDEYREITLLDLLTHRAGVPKNNVHGWPKGKPIRTLRYELIHQSLKPAPKQDVGQFYYSNLGFITAGAMLEKVSNKKWEDLIRDNLFDKLKMKSAGFGPPGFRDFDSKRSKLKAKSKKIDQPWGHSLDKEGNWSPVRIDNPPILGPAGTVHCSIKDWARFVSLHVSWVKRKPELLDAKSLEFLQKPHSEEGNACGWFAVNRNWGNGRVISHNGSNTFWMANVWGSPKKDFAVMTVTNCCSEESSQQLDEVAIKMVQRFAR